MPLGNFEDQQQLKMQLHYINYAFMLLSFFFVVFFFLGGENGGAVRFKIQQVRGRERDYSETTTHANASASAAVGNSLREKCVWLDVSFRGLRRLTGT